MQKPRDSAVVGAVQKLPGDVHRWSIANFMITSAKDDKFIGSPIIELDSCSIRLYVMTLVCNGFRGITMHALNAPEESSGGGVVVKCWIVKDGGRKSDDFSFEMCTAKSGIYRGGQESANVVMFHSIRDLNFHLVKDGTLTVDCEILDEDAAATTRSAKIATVLEIPTLYENLVGSKLCSDVTFLIDGKELHAHRVVLMASGTIFHDALTSSAAKSGHETIVSIEGVNYEAFKELVRFVYAGKVNGLRNIAEDLLVVSHRFGADRLKYVCEQVLCGRIDVDNALRYLRIADDCGCDALKTEATRVLTFNMEKIVARPEFDDFKDVKLVKEILRKIVDTNEE